jgi:transcriptional regulator with XRE-family HTH domain
MSFGENLQRLRLAVGLSQSGLAERTGIPVKTIQSWEISRRTPRWIDLLARLSRGLSVPMEALAGDSPEEEKQTQDRGRPRKPGPAATSGRKRGGPRRGERA